MFNPQMLNKIKKMQDDLKKAQDEINASTFYGQAGGSVIQVAVKGTKRVESVQIKQDEFDMSDIEMLQDLIVAAMNDAFAKVDKELEENIGSITQGINIPGMF